jgi:hypothetical protein
MYMAILALTQYMMNVNVVLHRFVNYITISSLSRASLVVTLLYVIIFTMHQS